MRTFLVVSFFLFLLFFGIGFIVGNRKAFSPSLPVARLEASPPTSEMADENAEVKTEEIQNPFDWSSIDSSNTAEFITKLRAIHCPERTINDIVKARIKAEYRRELVTLSKSGNFSTPGDQMRDRLLRRQEIDDEIDSVMFDQLKLKRFARSSGVLFSAEEEERIAESKTLFSTRNSSYPNPIAMQTNKWGRQARLEFLANYLSPEKIRYYKLDREGDGWRVASFLEGIQPTKQEFLGVADVIEGKEPHFQNGEYQPELAAALQAVLSPDNFVLLHDLRRPEYRALLWFGQMHQFSKDTLNSLVQLRRTWATKDQVTYKQQVEMFLKRPETVAHYLSDKTIHPGTSK